MSALTLYLILRCDALVVAFLLTSVLAAVAYVMVVFAYMATLDTSDPLVDESKFVKNLTWMRKVAGRTFVIALALTVVTPTTNQMAVIYIVPQIANNVQFQTDCKEVYDLAIKQMKKSLGDER